jgi:hypothetical protein
MGWAKIKFVGLWIQFLLARLGTCRIPVFGDVEQRVVARNVAVPMFYIKAELEYPPLRLRHI